MPNYRFKYFIFLNLLFWAVCLTLTAQKNEALPVLAAKDSLVKPLDSLFSASGVDSLKDHDADSTDKNQPDTVVSYAAENIRYLLKDSTELLILETRAVLKYKNISLSADTISLDLKTKNVKATYSIDTLKADGLTRLQDSVIYVGLPAMQEGEDIITGSSITYNLDTKEGRVAGSKTVMRNANPVDNTYFQAEQLLKLDDNNLNGLRAKITSCDRAEPHYYFLADSVIVTSNDWVFAKPITMHFGDVPVAYFPFVLYKKNSGRHSGLIIPSYDYSSARGNGLKHLGFFWDISPYLDYTITGDFYDLHSEFILDQNLRYNQKYSYNGNIAHRAFKDQDIKGWGLSGHHWQEFTPTTHLNADYNYVSNTSMVRKTGETANDRMQNKLTSNATFRKDWQQNGDYLLINGSLTQFVDTAIVQFTAPSFSFGLAGRKPFSKQKNWPSIVRAVNTGGSLSLDRRVNHLQDNHFYTDLTSFGLNLNENTKYENFTLSSGQNFSGSYLETRTQNTLSDIGESYSLQRSDSSDYNKILKTSTSLAYNHDLFSRFIKMEEKLSYNHDLAFCYTDVDGKLLKGLADRYTYGFSSSINTRIYGIFSPEIGSLQKIRHTIAPSLAFTYNPDFSKSEYGYFHYKSVTDTATGKISVQKIDKFAVSGIGATPTSESALLTYGLSNSFEAKLLNNDKTFDNRSLFTLGFGGNVDLLNDKFSDLNSRFNSTLYDGRILDKYLGLRLTSDAGANISTTNWQFMNYEYKYTVELPLAFDGRINKDFFQQFVEPDSLELKNRQLILKEKSVDAFTDMGLKLNATTSFSETRTRVLQPVYAKSYHKVFVTNLGVVLTPAANWNVEYHSQLNFTESRIVTATSISVVRDLHCWEGRFDWDLYNQGFKLLISTKSSIFKDLKFDKDTQKSRRY